MPQDWLLGQLSRAFRQLVVLLSSVGSPDPWFALPSGQPIGFDNPVFQPNAFEVRNENSSLYRSLISLELCLALSFVLSNLLFCLIMASLQKRGLLWTIISFAWINEPFLAAFTISTAFASASRSCLIPNWLVCADIVCNRRYNNYKQHTNPKQVSSWTVKDASKSAVKQFTPTGNATGLNRVTKEWYAILWLSKCYFSRRFRKTKPRT